MEDLFPSLRVSKSIAYANWFMCPSQQDTECHHHSCFFIKPFFCEEFTAKDEFIFILIIATIPTNSYIQSVKTSYIIPTYTYSNAFDIAVKEELISTASTIISITTNNYLKSD